MKNKSKIICVIVLLFVVCIFIYVAFNFKMDYIECTYTTTETSYGKILREFPERTSVLHINHLTKEVYSPQDISQEGRLEVDDRDYYEINTGLLYDKNSKSKSRIKINRITGEYMHFSKIEQIENNTRKMVEVKSFGVCKAVEPKF